MEKFSKMTGQSIPQEPTIEITKEEKEYLDMKYSILNLLDNFLSIRSYGNPRQELVGGNLQIDGKEMFAEALIDLVKGESKKENIKVLESMRAETGDWFVLDKKINELSSSLKSMTDKADSVRRTNIRNFLETYSENSSFEIMLEKYVGRLNDSKESYLRGVVANSMINKSNDSNRNQKLNLLAESLFKRSKQLIRL